MELLQEEAVDLSVQKLSMLRRKVAERLVAANETAMLTTSMK
jgi:hypothetical protein